MSARYQVVFTPVGWQVVDTVETRDPLYEFGTGREEYARASAAATRANGRGIIPPVYVSPRTFNANPAERKR